jgi:cation diffusion facilitator family transporter
MTETNPTDCALESGAHQNPKEIRRITWIGLAANLLLAAIKFVFGFMGRSQAVVADAVHSLSDMITDIAILVGVRFWSLPADEDHPYGHRRIETIVTVGIGISLTVAAAGIGYKGVAALGQENVTQPGWIAFVAAVVSILIKEILYRWTISVGRREHSPGVIANAWHHRSDALSSIPAAIAVAVAAFKPELTYVDQVGAIIVSLFILHAAWRIMKPALYELSDMGASGAVTEEIRAVGIDVDDVEDVHAIRTRKMGSGIYVDLHVTVDGGMTVAKGHDVSEAVKGRIKERVSNVLDVVVHLEPSDEHDAFED